VRDRGAGGDPIAEELRSGLGLLLEESKTRRRTPRPAGEAS